MMTMKFMIEYIDPSPTSSDPTTKLISPSISILVTKHNLSLSVKYSLPYFVFILRLGVKLLARQHLRAGNVSSSWNCLAPFFFVQSNFTSAFWAITTQALFLLFPLQAGPSDLTAIPHMWVVSLGSVTTCPHCFAALFSCFLRMYYKVQICVDFSVKCSLYITSRWWYCGVTKRWYRGTRLPPLLLVVETANCPILSSANINPREDFPFAHHHFYQIK